VKWLAIREGLRERAQVLMRLRRVLRRLSAYLARDGLKGWAHFTAELIFWRLANARAVYRLWRWKKLIRESGACGPFRDIEGVRFYLNPKDTGLSAELAVEGMHEPKLTAALRGLLRPGMVLVDVGANIGYFALLAARCVSPGGKVIALEPFPESYRLLQKNVKANGFGNVVTLQVAAGVAAGHAALYVYERANWNSLGPPRAGVIGAVPVRVEPLDVVLSGEERVDVVRMDVEGAEYDVLLGARGILARDLPYLVIEVHRRLLGEGGYRRLREFVLDLGYDKWLTWQRWQEEIVWPAGVAAMLRFDGLLANECWILGSSRRES
jgi:FkbM family methyltransferase